MIRASNLSSNCCKMKSFVETLCMHLKLLAWISNLVILCYLPIFGRAFSVIAKSELQTCDKTSNDPQQLQCGSKILMALTITNSQEVLKRGMKYIYINIC